MGIFTKNYEVPPYKTGFLFRNNIFEKQLESGFYEISDWKNKTKLYILPKNIQLISVTNQEILTKDNIALRFSFNITYRVADGLKLLENTDLELPYILGSIENKLQNMVQIYFRRIISEIESENLNEKRSEWSNLKPEELQKEAETFGIQIESIQVRDITFPKSIQDLFAKHLEAKIRSKADLENARTAVATARALKNASELMKNDDNIKFFQMLETISKIAEKGKHTFMIGDINALTNKNNGKE
ncbi:slipin family protein [Capnocytophaga sp.]|uniref:slipin family protein n=1 Tax=Capnocytophaga sp. TaxID=44737 RepID=UPI0026DAF3A7|nr:slipin family protein [Capnocytophaga sp.]MDO5106519.1 slipin family protein [Capnocytophaga sp.]